MPSGARPVFMHVAPYWVFLSVFLCLPILPLYSVWGGGVVGGSLFLLLSIVSLDVGGIVMAGWGSNSKLAMLGAMRSAAQMVSYEVPLGLTILAVVCVTGTLDLSEIMAFQAPAEGGHATLQAPLRHEGFLRWTLVRCPLLIPVFGVYFVTMLAKASRSPFDLAESDSELVGGYHTEYGGFRWAIFMFYEYAMLVLFSVLGVILFFGGWHSPLMDAGGLRLGTWTEGYGFRAFWLFSKASMLVFGAIWVRWTLPRFRLDQLMRLCWKTLIPVSLLLVFLCVLWRIFVM